MSSTTASHVRAQFLDFFKQNGHEVVASGPLVPGNDPTLMFANAGMVQFKDVFTGRDKRSYSRAASSQKCIRISGKHNDLENVGRTARHHTFFEMLGNFSFGDYFKEEAIKYGWELITKGYGISPDRLVVTYFKGDDEVPRDDEAASLWKKISGLPESRIIGMGRADNFWSMGDTGPCGPCSEIHYRQGKGAVDPSTFGDEPAADGSGWMEIWNLVFMQFERFVEGSGFGMRNLPKPSVDTGMGLERIASVVQGVTSNYDTDLLRALVDHASRISGKKYGASMAEDDVSMRVIADHARTTAFLIAEGIFPDRADRPYVLRRVMRRAIRHGHRLGIQKPFLHEVALSVVERMGEQYPELKNRRDTIASITEQEEVRFRQTLERGLKLLDEELTSKHVRSGHVLPGETAFKLSDTFGFPIDLTQVICEERGVRVDVEGYEESLEAARKRSEGSKVGEAAVADVHHQLAQSIGEIAFSGYEHEHGESKLRALVGRGARVNALNAGDEGELIVERTPFYGESGGQIGDQGVITTAGGARFVVTDTQKPVTGLIVHRGRVEAGVFKEGDAVSLEVDHERRAATRRNHSATHLLHYALRTVLGEHVQQKGSLVGPERLRFDYAHGKALSAEEIARIEDLVNEMILDNVEVKTEVMAIDDARRSGAMAIFEEKYGDTVRVLSMRAHRHASVELCGGTHARRTGDIGMFKLVTDRAIAAGVRRVEAVTGFNTLREVRAEERALAPLLKLLASDAHGAAAKLEKLIADEKALEKKLADAEKKLALAGSSGGGGVDSMIANARQFAGFRALSVRVDIADAAALRELADQLRDKLGDAVVLVGSAAGGKASLVLTVSKSLTGKLKAGELIKPLASVIGGSGGGRPDMAQAGGTNLDALDGALAELYARLG
jgi:alanyl-tRNA synthetase